MLLIQIFKVCKVFHLKILIIGANFTAPGGTERVGCMIANGIYEAGYEVVIASISYTNKPFFPMNENIKIISLFNSPKRFLYRAPNIIWKIRKILKQESIDTIIVVESMLVLFTLPAILGLSIKHICWEHFNFNSDLGKSGRRVARQLAARYCDTVVTLTQKDKSYWLKGTKHKSQISAIPNPCPYPITKNVKKENTKIVLAAGRLTYQKGFDLLLESWREVNKCMPEWKLKIVGDGNDRDKLNKIIKKNELINSVELVGNTNDMSKYYMEAEIFCLSSRFEGFGMVLIEALAFGLPIVSFDCEVGPAEILKDTGSILVTSDNIQELANSLMIMMKDENGRKEIAINSRKKAEHYQIENIIPQWISIIEN